MGKFHISCIFTGGREESVEVGIVDSNYHARERKEVQIVLNRAVSLSTLKDIVAWAEEKQKEGYRLT